MDALARLIERELARGLKVEDIEQRIPHATLHGYMNPKRQREQPIRKRQMQELALALDVPLSEVEFAAVASVGYSFMRGLAIGDPQTEAIVGEEISDIPRPRAIRSVEHAPLHPPE
jgi:hypothetical protein